MFSCLSRIFRFFASLFHKRYVIAFIFVNLVKESLQDPEM